MIKSYFGIFGDFFTKNIGLKLLALLIAVLIWFFVLASVNRINYFPGSLPVEVVNVPTGLAAIYDPQRIKVKLQASTDNWKRLSQDNIHAYVDLDGFKEGTFTADINVNVNVPSVNVVDKTPATLLVRLEPIIQKRVSVKVLFIGQPSPGFVAGEPIVNPSEVVVQGPKSFVDEISELEAQIELNGENRDFQKKVSLSANNISKGKTVTINIFPSSVNVLTVIAPSSGTKTVGVTAKIRGEPASGYYISKIECTPAVVEISSAIGSLQAYQYLETQEITIDGLQKNLVREVEISVPSGITVKQHRVIVRISLSPNMTHRVVLATFTTKVSPDLKLTSFEPVKVNVFGPMEDINELITDKVIITLDLENIGAGVHTGIEIKRGMISLPPGCTALSWSPSRITIILENK